MTNITYFADSAQEAMGMKTTFGLSALLRNSGDKIGDKNDLEKLIDSFESK